MNALRPLTPNEQALLAGFLAFDFPGVEALREQSRSILAAPGCTCGCGSLDLFPQGQPPLSSARTPLPSEGRLRNEAGDEVGGLICLAQDGLLSYLEVYAYDEPPPLPPAERVEWVF